MNPIRVLLVDDHRMFLQSLRMLIETEPDLQIVGECTSGVEAIEAVLRLQPDVVLMDINMPGMNGIDATRQILERRPATRILILTMYHEDAQVFHAIKNGARGYILKDRDISEVVNAVRAAARGDAIVDPTLTAHLLAEFQRVWHEPVNRAGHRLTDREVAILRLIAAGLSNKEIGAQLNFSEKTIKNYVSAILQKLQLADRTQAAVYALQHGLIDKTGMGTPDPGDAG